MTWNTYEEILADIMADKPKPPKPKPSPEQQLEERGAKKSGEAIFQDAINSTNAAVKRAEETIEERRAKQRAKEFAEHNSESPLWHALVHWRQSIDYAQERLRALDGEDPETGNYDPIRRFEREMRGR